jgi:hypothetical protein
VAEKFWDRQKQADRAEFARFMAPLVTASRTREFTTAEAIVYMMTLGDVPRDVLALGVTQLLEQGVTWMPKPGDIKNACASIVDERRATAARQAMALTENCPDCRGTGWADAEGPNAVVRCNCAKRAVELVQAAGAALPRLLPPSGDEAA